MVTIRKASERGHFDHGWLDTRHTFSFADYYDAAHMGFRSLRVINEDRIQPGEGFGTHPHKDMEIVSYVLEGALAHKDSMGNGSIILPGDVQRMSAGRGVTHSEFNHEQGSSTHFLQIWILPDKNGLPPSYEQRRFTDEEKRGHLRLVASGNGRNGSVTLHQDADMYVSLLALGTKVEHNLQAGRGAWIQIVRGDVTLDGQRLAEGDGASVENEQKLSIECLAESELLLFDLA